MATTNAQEMKHYKHIFFDLDRTLWDFDASSIAVFEFMYEKHHLNELGIPSALDFHDTYEPHNLELWKDYRENKITKEELNLARFGYPLSLYGIESPELAQKLSEDYVKYCPLTVRIIPGAFEILDYLKPKYHLHLITNGFKEVQDIKLSKSGFKPYFETLIISEDVGIKKPDPQIFLYALEKVNASADESIMIGDEMEVDIDGARAAHIDQIYFNQKGKLEEGERTFEVKTLLEIKEIL